jgi:Single-strand binding protein family
VRVAVHGSRQNDRDPVIWQPGQDYRAADVIQAARTQPTRARYGPEATPRSCGSTCGAARPSTWPSPFSKGDRVMITGRLRQRSWETPEGDKRSVTEIEADELGASLKWATAKVERSSQRGNGQRDQGRERQAERGGDFNEPPPF